MADQLTCRICRTPIRPATPQTRVGPSAWVGDTTCTDSGGHIPTDPPPMRRWAVYDDGEAVPGAVIPGASTSTEAAHLARIGWMDGAGQTGAGRRLRYELRPLEPGEMRLP